MACTAPSSLLYSDIMSLPRNMGIILHVGKRLLIGLYNKMWINVNHCQKHGNNVRKFSHMLVQKSTSKFWFDLIINTINCLNHVNHIQYHKKLSEVGGTISSTARKNGNHHVVINMSNWSQFKYHSKSTFNIALALQWQIHVGYDIDKNLSSQSCIYAYKIWILK